MRLNNGLPNRLTQVITVNDSDARIKVTRNLWPTSFYAQDQWTHDRLTLQGGVRYDYYLMNYPDQIGRRPGLYGFGAAGDRVPVAVDAQVQVARRHAAHGRRLRPVRQRQDGDQVQPGQVHAGRDGDQQRPRSQPDHSHRDQHDADVDRLEQGFRAGLRPVEPEKNGECEAMHNRNLGQRGLRPDLRPWLRQGWGVRPYTWSLGLSVQQEVAPRVSVNVGYFRNWWGNWYTVDNRTNATADWTPFSIKAPVDPRLPGGGGQVINGLYNLVPTTVGQVDEWATNSKNYAEQTENWQGVDVGLGARLRNGLTVQGGTSTGRQLSDFVRAESGPAGAGPGHARGDNLDRCGRRLAGEPVLSRVVEPYLTSIRDWRRTRFRRSISR